MSGRLRAPFARPSAAARTARPGSGMRLRRWIGSVAAFGLTASVCLTPSTVAAQSSAAAAQSSAAAAGLLERVDHHYADSDGVAIHYVTAGEGPLVVMIHGFPDFWYSWRDQIGALEGGYRVAAIDMRGYNRSDKPTGLESYTLEKLVGDVAAVIADQGRERAIVMGHDWGGWVAWSVAMTRPDLVERLVVLNLPHPHNLQRELATNPEQARNSQYARDFQKPEAHASLTAEGLSGWVRDEAARAHHVEAMRRSDFEAMLAYYKENYPREPYEAPLGDPTPVRAPTLVIHGLDDPYLLAGALDGTWRWIDAELTVVTIPGAGHFVRQDAPERVTDAIVRWLGR